MKRLYFLLPDAETAKAIVDELLLKRVEERHIHLVAREDAMLEDLPKASLTHRTDLIPALERGLTLGGATGAVAGLAAVSFPPLGLALGGGGVLGVTLLGSGFGAWASAMLGVSTPNSRLKQFQEDIQNGKLLMMIDTPASRVEDVEELIRSHHPEADVEGTEATIPPFP